MTFVHQIRVRYAEVDQQKVVFNAHWLTYFDEANTRFFDEFRTPAELFGGAFDCMLVRAVLEWQGPARFDDIVAVAVETVRLGTSSFDIRYTATVDGRPACVGVITYVSIDPSEQRPTPIPPEIRAWLTAALAN